MLFRKAILIIHGYAGGTYDEEDLANYLELNKFYDVFQFTLPGHSKNLSKVKYQDWINKSEEMMNFLIDNGYKSIYLIEKTSIKEVNLTNVHTLHKLS